MPLSKYLQTAPRGTRMPCERAGQVANAIRIVTMRRGPNNSFGLSFGGAADSGTPSFREVSTSVRFSNPGAKETPPKGNAANPLVLKDRCFTNFLLEGTADMIQRQAWKSTRVPYVLSKNRPLAGRSAFELRASLELRVWNWELFI